VRAVVRDRYGPPDVLRVEDVPEPVPGPRQVLVRVAAVSVNLSDWENLVGRPAYARIGGLRRPARRVLGSDVAGTVESVGDGVTRFAPGDRVYGDNLALMGGFAELAVVPERALAAVPPGWGLVEASTVPQAGAIALQGTAGAAPGARWLVNGGGGGSGSFAIQLAKQAGAHVTAVDGAGKLDFMRSLGADEVLDHRRTDWTATGPYDRVLDLVALRSVRSYRRALAPGGRYRCVGGTARTMLAVATAGRLVGAATGRDLGVLVVRAGPSHFEPLGRLCVEGRVAVHVERTYRLDQVAEALAHVGAGRALGKVVVEVAQDS
jgi:NADPH:quinone reductase-like Zn-dependent oxidoreductase